MSGHIVHVYDSCIGIIHEAGEDEVSAYSEEAYCFCSTRGEIACIGISIYRLYDSMP